MSGGERLELRHGRLSHTFNLALCVGLVLLFAGQATSGQEGAAVLLLPALILFGGFGLRSALCLFDRRPVAVLDREGVWIPELMSRPLPWRAVEAVEERRFGRSRLFLYVADTRPWLRPDRRGGFGPEALGNLLPGFARPRITLATHWLDHSHREIRAAVASFWGVARAGEGASPVR
jgi:hypothetical protein